MFQLRFEECTEINQMEEERQQTARSLETGIRTMC